MIKNIDIQMHLRAHNHGEEIDFPSAPKLLGRLAPLAHFNLIVQR